MAQLLLGEDPQPLIDPEVRAFVFSLASALGGWSADGSGKYVLGDDALAVLKDVKRWLRVYDDQSSRFDVARLLADANFVKGDLLQILASWPEDSPEGSFRSKVAMYSVDLLTQLTWPIEKRDEEISANHLLHIPYIQSSHASYKAATLHHETCQILRTVVRVGLPSMALPRKERNQFQDNIIKVVLYFFRNIAMIEKPQGSTTEDDDIEISRSTTIDAFHRQDIFDLLLTIGSGLNDEFDTHDVEVLDILYHLVKGIDVNRLFMDRDELMSANAKELQDLMQREKAMLASYARHAPTRHSRFTPMMWVKRKGEKSTTLLGQSAFADEQSTMQEMDKRKTWKKPRRPAKNGKTTTEFTPDNINNDIPLTASARRQLHSFIANFLDSSFNPLFFSVRKAIEREANRVLGQHTRQYFFMISWLLRAESARRKRAASDRAAGNVQGAAADTESFSLIAAVMNQETFVLLNRQMQGAYDNREWDHLTACMKCFSQILSTVQEMFESSVEEDQEIAENILSRIFYEQTTHDRIVSLLRTYNGQDFAYLDAVTELAHVFLRLLERYSKVNVDLQVRRIRHVRKKKLQQQNVTEDYDPNVDNAMKTKDVQEAEKVSSERKFEFGRFAARFVNQQTVDTFATLLKYYRDLTEDQLKRAHRFFYRVAFKMETGVLLYRADIILLLNNMIKGSNALDKDLKISREWEELVRQVFRQLIKKLEKTPALAVEMLFSKIPSSMFFLEHGYDMEAPKRNYRAPAELEVKPGTEHEAAIGVAVSLLVNQGKSGLLAWVKTLLSTTADERQAWKDAADALRESEQPVATVETAAEGEGDIVQSVEPASASLDATTSAVEIKAEDTEQLEALAKDKHFRLLLTLLSFYNEPTLNPTSQSLQDFAKWSIPGPVSAETLRSDHALISRFEFEPPTYDDGKTAEDFIRRKVAPRQAAAPRNPDGLDTDSDGGSIPSDLDQQLFPAGGPDVRPNDWTAADKPKRRRLHQKKDVSENVLAQRRAARRKKDAEKAQKIKSQLFVSLSDDESDEERDRQFFAAEEHRRKKASAGVTAELQRLASKPSKKKRKAVEDTVDSDSASAASSNEDESSSPPKRRKTALQEDSDADTEDNMDDDDDIDMLSDAGSLPSRRGGRRSRQAPITSASDSEDDEDDEAATDTDTPPSSQRPSSGHGVEKTTATAAAAADEASDKENVSVPLKSSFPMPGRRRGVGMRGGFIIDSDSDE